MDDYTDLDAARAVATAMQGRVTELETAIRASLVLLRRKNQSGQSLWLKYAIQALEEALNVKTGQ